MLNEKNTGLVLRPYHIWILSITMFFAANMNYDWRLNYVTWYGTLALIFVSFLMTYNGRIKLKGLSFSVWFLSFILLGFVSFIWSLSTSVAFDVLKTLIVHIVVLLLMQISISFGCKIETYLKCYFIATIVTSIYIVLTIDIAQLGDVQLGAQMMDAWNGNGIGFMAAQGVLIGCYLFTRSKEKTEKTLVLIGTIALAFLTLYTGSRTAFLMLLAELILYLFLSKPTKLVRNVFFSIVVVVLAFYLVMNVESFYRVLGVRLEGLFALFGGEGEVDSSSDIRNTFIENGKRWFSEKPILGYGINNYKVLNREATGRFTYAHNTFIELAVDLGVVGLVWYYSVYVYLAGKLFKNFKNNPMNVFLLSALIASLFSQYGTVSYYGFYQNFLLLLCFIAVNQKEDNTGTLPRKNSFLK